MSTTVVNCRTEKYDVYIGRPSKWGNPFRLGPYGRALAILEYRKWIARQPQLISALHELKGKKLGCYCKPLPCHGDILAELADAIS